MIPPLTACTRWEHRETVSLACSAPSCRTCVTGNASEPRAHLLARLTGAGWREGHEGLRCPRHGRGSATLLA